jgi:CMP-N,N'-diacetyllegionaminic acid synthase
MINGLNILVVIPARGGSKGVKLKNLRKVGGIPIVELAARIASKINYIDRIVVSTDHEEIAKTAIKGGADAPFRRPKNISGDRVSDFQVLLHSLLEIEKIDNKTYGVVVMLQPTSPLRSSKDVNAAIQTLFKGNFDSVWTVSETDKKYHPLKQLIFKNNILDYYDQKGKEIIARQQLDKVYHRNGIAYVIRREILINDQAIMGKNSGACIIEGEHVSIDTEEDFELVNSMFH